MGAPASAIAAWTLAAAATASTPSRRPAARSGPTSKRKTTVRTPRPHQLVPALLQRHVLPGLHVRQLATRMALEHDGQRRPVGLRELDLVLLGGAGLRCAPPPPPQRAPPTRASTSPSARAKISWACFMTLTCVDTVSGHRRAWVVSFVISSAFGRDAGPERPLQQKENHPLRQKMDTRTPRPRVLVVERISSFGSPHALRVPRGESQATFRALVPRRAERPIHSVSDSSLGSIS